MATLKAFKEWVFTVELALRSKRYQRRSMSSRVRFYVARRNALLWLIAAQDAGKSFGDWLSLKNAFAETFGPIQNEEENRLALFSLYQINSLDEYIRDFTRLSLLVTGLDEHCRAVCLIRGLRDNLRAEAMREHTGPCRTLLWQLAHPLDCAVWCIMMCGELLRTLGNKRKFQTIFKRPCDHPHVGSFKMRNGRS